MKNYSRPRPTLPDSTPFLPGTKYSIVTPWHGKSTPSVDLTKEGSNYGSMESTGSLKRSATVGIMPNLSVNSKTLVSSRKKKSPQRTMNTELSLLADGGSSLTQSQEHSLGKFSKQVSNMSLTGRSVLLEEIHRKSQEANSIRETAEVVIDRTRAVEKKLESLKEVEEVEMFQTARRKKIINSLSTINMMLINILEALELQPESDDGLTETMLKYRAVLLPDMEAAKHSPDGRAKGKLSKNDVYAINAKLRTMILTMSREYYRSSKQVKNAFTIYEGLRSELRAVEQRNRAVQHDVDEMRKEEMSNAASKMMSQQRAGFAALEIRDVYSEAEKKLNFEDDLKVSSV
jgi:hypothetical protein